MAAGLVAVWLALAGCGRPEKVAPATPPPPVYTGPGFLRGTVASMARLRGYEPMLVSGWGFVVNLHGTGATSVPAYLRQWLVNYMRRQGVGSARLAGSSNPLAEMTPAQIIADPNTAAVEVFGLIPPGATRGTRFDLFVTALEGTQTTSLADGDLLPCELSLGGSNRQMKFTRKQAVGRGPIYVSPKAPAAAGDEALQRRKAVVLAGGQVSEDRPIELVLNQPSWQRSRDIADRINERFPKDSVDRRDTAVPQTDLLISLHIPTRYRNDPERLLALISNLFIQRQENFELIKGQQLGEVLRRSEPGQYDEQIALAWEALGKPALPVIQSHYDDAEARVALAALEAGARLGDERASGRLSELAGHEDAEVRKRVARALAFLPSSLRGASILRTLVDDADDTVRIAAYESLVSSGDPKVKRLVMAQYHLVRDELTKRDSRQLKPETFKFALDLVPSTRPMVFIGQRGMPRIVVFNPMVEFDAPMLAKLWDNHLMVRADAPKANAQVFYQPFNGPQAVTVEIAPTLANLIYLMAHKPSVENPSQGLDLSFSQVAQAVYQLCESGAVAYRVVLEDNTLVDEVEAMVRQLPSLPRPESGERGDRGPVTGEDEPMPPAGEGFIDLPTMRDRTPPSAPRDGEPQPVPDSGASPRPDTLP